MRPINKGAWPLDPATNQPKVFHSDKAKDDRRYKQAGQYLKERLGLYCSYCERKVNSSLHVEHKLPKRADAYPELRGDWDNFLLACSECDSRKKASMEQSWQFKPGKQPPSAQTVRDYYCWPDQENTFCLFCFEEKSITVQTTLDIAVCERAKCTLDLIALSSLPDTDSRSAQIRQVWKKAREMRQSLENFKDQPVYRDLLKSILHCAEDAGCWSIWMTVFQDYADVRAELIKLFPGTRQDCLSEETVETQQLISQNSPKETQLIIGSPPYQEMDLMNQALDSSSKTDKKSSNSQRTNNTAQRRSGKEKKSNARAARSGQQVKMPESLTLGGSEAVQQPPKTSKHPKWKIKSKLKAKLRNKKHSKSKGKKR